MAAIEAKTGRQAERTRNARDQMTQAALTVFALKGYAATSMDDVCLAAGCSKGGLYHHFRTKSALLAAAVDKLAAQGALNPPFEAATQPSLPAPALARVLLEVWAEAARDEALRERLRAALAANSAAPASPVAEMLHIGALVELLSRGEPVDAAAVARRLSERAA
jgi:AcrR family transcriptional regulator